MKEKHIIDEKRLKVSEKIKLYETLKGEYLFCDVEDDPPAKMLYPKDVDYLKTRAKSKFLNVICKIIVSLMLKRYAKERQITVIGLDNLQNVGAGAVLTTNHFNPFDSAPVIYAIKKSRKRKKLHIVIREGNYQIPGFFGFLLKNYDTFPLSSNVKTTIELNKAIDKVLNRGEYLLVYPEQAMWRDYRKPRDYRIGAFRWAARNNVPVVPCFTVMEDMEKREKDGLKKQKLTLFIGKPIFPDITKTEKENASVMLKKNKEFTVSVYENFYDKKYDL